MIKSPAMVRTGNSMFAIFAMQGEIRACAFNQVAEKLNSTFEMGKVSDHTYMHETVTIAPCGSAAFTPVFSPAYIRHIGPIFLHDCFFL